MGFLNLIGSIVTITCSASSNKVADTIVFIGTPSLMHCFITHNFKRVATFNHKNAINKRNKCQKTYKLQQTWSSQHLNLKDLVPNVVFFLSTTYNLDSTS